MLVVTTDKCKPQMVAF